MQVNEYAQRIKEVREELNLSQEDLARALGVSFATVNRWENDRTKPSKLAWTQFERFCEEKNIRGNIN